MRILPFFGLFTSLLVFGLSTGALAGGGGCDGECPRIPNDYLGTCVLDTVKVFNKDSLAHDPISRKLVDNIRANGLTIELRGDARTIRSSRGSLFTKDHRNELITYRGEDPIDLDTSTFHTIQSYKYRYSIGMNDPRPMVTDFFVEIRKKERDRPARMRLVQLAMLDKNDPWKRSHVFVLSGEMNCQLPSAPVPRKD